MEREVAWKKYDEASLDELEALAVDYIDFISENKTERECAAAAIAAAEDAGYDSLADCIAAGTPVGPGSKLWACAQGKAVILVHVGAAPISEGMNILGAHIDSPRLDIKQNPLYETNDFALLDTHYYGGIKNYQWTALPLALHGVVAKTDGAVVEVNIGDDPADPVFCVTDLLPHLGSQQMDKKGSKVVEGEDLDVLVGNRPLAATGADEADDGAGKAEGDKASKDPVKAYVLALLSDKYGIAEEDFLSAELEVVPAGPRPRPRLRSFHGHRLRPRTTACAPTPPLRPSWPWATTSPPHRCLRAGGQGGDRQRGRLRHGLDVL